MKAFAKAFVTELKRNILSLKFPVMILLVTAGYIVSSIEELKFMWNYPKSDVIYFFVLSHNVGSFTILSVLCCTVLNCISFLQDYKSGYFRQCIIRSGKGCYAITKYLSCVISGGLILSLGQILFVVILATKFPLINQNSSMAESIIHGSDFTGELLANGYEVGYFMVYALIAFMYGALWSGVGVTVSAFFDDYYAASFSPYLLSLASSGVLSGFFAPDIIFRCAFNLGGIFKSVLGAIIYLSAIIAVLGMLFCKRVRWRCEE